MAKIFFTGGGTAGHVTPNLALIEVLLSEGWQCEYVGSNQGVERELVAPLGIPFHGIQSGKLRRYFSWQNFIDPIFVLIGLVQSIWLCLAKRPDIVFSKGGFVAVPLVFAAWLCRIPVISHESDITPGLANKLALPFVKKLCVNFEQTLSYLSESARSRVLVTGSPLRGGLLNTSAAAGRSFLQWDSHKPVLLVVGGSLGANAINEAIWQNLSWLLEEFDVVHIVGPGNSNAALTPKGYQQFEYLKDEYGDVLASADLVISRAGANAIYELLAFGKPHLLIPLTAAASRGDQLVNARVMADAGVSEVLQEDAITADALRQGIARLKEQSLTNSTAGAAITKTGAADAIVTLIKAEAKKSP